MKPNRVAIIGFGRLGQACAAAIRADEHGQYSTTLGKP